MVRLCQRPRLVDPHRSGQRWRCGHAPDKAFRGSREGLVLDELPFAAPPLGVPVMDIPRRQPPQGTVMVYGVIPVEEGEQEAPRVREAAEPVRELGVVLERLEPALRVGVVVRDVGPAVSRTHAQVRQQHGHRVGEHRRAAIRMDRQLVPGDALSGTGLGDQLGVGRNGRPPPTPARWSE